MDIAWHEGLSLLNRELHGGGLLYGAYVGGHSNGVGFGRLKQTEAAAASGKREVGANVMEMLQLAPAATDAPQLLVCVKLVAFAPVSAMLVVVRAAAPELVSVTVCVPLVVLIAWLPKATEAGVNVTAGYANV